MVYIELLYCLIIILLNSSCLNPQWNLFYHQPFRFSHIGSNAGFLEFISHLWIQFLTIM
jgi:hypothetical protein